MTATTQFSPSIRKALADDEVRTQVWALLSTLYPKVTVVERRRETRYPFPFLIYLTPVDDDGTTPCGESIVVVGKHVSERGLGFYHAKPLAHRRVVASLERPHDGWYAFLLDLAGAVSRGKAGTKAAGGSWNR